MQLRSVTSVVVLNDLWKFGGEAIRLVIRRALVQIPLNKALNPHLLRWINNNCNVLSLLCVRVDRDASHRWSFITRIKEAILTLC